MRSKDFFLNLLALPGIVGLLSKNVWKQKNFLAVTVEKEITPFRKSNDGSLTPADFKKITDYYALGVPGILGEAFCVLRGTAMLEKERFRLTYLGGISGLLDDLFDDPDKKQAHLEEFILKPEELVPENKYEELLLHFYKKGLENSVQPNALKQQAMKVFRAQQQSVQQNFAILSPEKIKELTDHKGGTSFLFYRLCLEPPLTPPEEKLHFTLGGLMQMGNDIFDVWEDSNAGTRTMATETTDIQEMRKLFILEMEKCFSAVSETAFSKKNKIQFLQIISLAMARVFVCLDQFEKLQKTTNNRFLPAQYKRDQLICDMQKPINQISATKYFLSFEIRKFLA